MKSAIVYYSYSGNTRKVALELKNQLDRRGFVEMIELKALDETDSFLGQCKRALFKKEAQIADAKFDLSEFDLVCLGTPVWAFAPAPAINTYLKKCSGVTDKSVIIFTTYGSGIGNNRCIKIIQETLKQKGATQFCSFSVQQFKVYNKDFILDVLNHVL